MERTPFFSTKGAVIGSDRATSLGMRKRKAAFPEPKSLEFPPSIAFLVFDYAGVSAVLWDSVRISDLKTYVDTVGANNHVSLLCRAVGEDDLAGVGINLENLGRQLNRRGWAWTAL